MIKFMNATLLRSHLRIKMVFVTLKGLQFCTYIPLCLCNARWRHHRMFLKLKIWPNLGVVIHHGRQNKLIKMKIKVQV